MKITVSFRRRLKQLFCPHDRRVGIGCAVRGINSKEGHYHTVYTCNDCGFAHSEWIKADKEEVEKLFNKKGNWFIK